MSRLEKLSPPTLARLNNQFDDNRTFFGHCKAVALACVGADVAEADYKNAVADSVLYRSHPDRRKARSDTATAWVKAYEEGDPAWKPGTLQGRLEQLLSAVVAAPWKDPELQQAATVFVTAAYVTNVYTLDFGVRDMRAALGVSDSHASALLRRLGGAGLWISRNHQGFRKRTRFVVNTSWAPDGANREMYNRATIRRMLTHVFANAHFMVWTAHGLGPWAGRVFQAVTEEPATKTAICQASGVSRRRVGTALTVLADAGLVDVVTRGSRELFTVSGGAADRLTDLETEAVQAKAIQVIAVLGQREADAETRTKFREKTKGTVFEVEPFYRGDRAGEVVALVEQLGWPKTMPVRATRVLETLVDKFGGNEFLWMDALQHEDSATRRALLLAGYQVPEGRGVEEATKPPRYADAFTEDFTPDTDNELARSIEEIGKRPDPGWWKPGQDPKEAPSGDPFKDALANEK